MPRPFTRSIWAIWSKGLGTATLVAVSAGGRDG